MVKIQYATISETGTRKNNEDAFRMIGMSDGNRWLAVVCDGMGGHDKGEVASETVADAIVNYWRKAEDEIDSKDKYRVLQTLFVILHLLVDSINILFLMHKAKYMGKPLVIPDALILLHRFNSI